MTDHTNPPITVAQAEETLRSLTQIPAPEGLQDRIHARLAEARQAEKPIGLFSRLVSGTGWGLSLRIAVAAGTLAIIALVVDVSYPHRYTGQPTQTGVHGTALPAQGPAPVSPGQDSSSGFRTAGAQRVPPTLTPLHVAPVPKKRLHGSKTAAPTGSPAKPQTAQPAAVASPAKP